MYKNRTYFHGCIYKYTNLINGKIYVGQTSNLKRRRYYHENLKNVKYPIDKALSKYGFTNFKFEVLTEVSSNSYEEYKKTIDEFERYYIRLFKEQGFILYNITEGGGYSWSDYNNNRIYTSLSDSHKHKIQKSLRNYYDTHKSYCHSGGRNPKAKKIVGIKNGNVVCMYDCGKDLCSILGMNYSTFKYRIRNKSLIINNILYLYESDFKENI